jgi:hypothetical protein
MWKTFNDSLKQQVEANPADATAQKYFQALFQYTEEEQVAYLQKIRENNKYVYDRLKAEFARLDIDESAISIAESDDPGTCYVAFHYQEFAARVFDTDVSFANVHNLNMDILEQGINELMRKIGLPISMRMSFGFPITNLGETGKEIRLTVGIEERAMLDEYIKVLTYVNGKVSQKAATDIATFKDGAVRKRFMTELVGDINTITKLDAKLQPLFKTV